MATYRPRQLDLVRLEFPAAGQMFAVCGRGVPNAARDFETAGGQWDSRRGCWIFDGASFDEIVSILDAHRLRYYMLYESSPSQQPRPSAPFGQAQFAQASPPYVPPPMMDESQQDLEGWSGEAEFERETKRLGQSVNSTDTFSPERQPSSQSRRSRSRSRSPSPPRAPRARSSTRATQPLMLEFARSGDSFSVRGKQTFGIKDDLKELGGTWNPERKCWVLQSAKYPDVIDLLASQRIAYSEPEAQSDNDEDDDDDDMNMKNDTDDESDL